MPVKDQKGITRGDKIPISLRKADIMCVAASRYSVISATQQYCRRSPSSKNELVPKPRSKL